MLVTVLAISFLKKLIDEYPFERRAELTE